MSDGRERRPWLRVVTVIGRNVIGWTMRGKRELTRAAIRSARVETSSSGGGRVAGRREMADPDVAWDIVAEASDESFPCSDPPAWSPIRVGASEKA